MKSHVQKHVPWKEIWDSRERLEHSSYCSCFFGCFTMKDLMKKQHAGYAVYNHSTGLCMSITRQDYKQV